MAKSDLIRAIAAQNLSLSLAECAALIDAFFETISGHLAEGGRVELRGFGAFNLSEIKDRPTRNPRTGEVIGTRATLAVRFRPSKGIKDKLNAY